MLRSALLSLSIALAAASPARAGDCAAATHALVHGAEVTPVALDAQDFTPTPAEREAIARAAKSYNIQRYEGAERRRLAAAFDRFIADGAHFDVLQAVRLPIDPDRRPDRVVIITFRRDHVTIWFDPTARITGALDANGDHWRDLVLEHQHGPSGVRDVWLLSARGSADPTGAILEMQSCTAGE